MFGSLTRLSFCWFVLAAFSHAQELSELRYKFAEGQTLRYRVTQAATLSGEAGVAGGFEMKTEQTAELAWQIKSVNDSGVATIEQTIAKLKFKNSSPVGEVGFDSGSDDPAMGVAAMLAPAAQALLETPVTFTVSPIGEVGPIKAPEALIGALERVPGAAEVLEGEPALRAMIEAVLPLLPEVDKPSKRTSKPILPSLNEQKLTTEFRRDGVEGSGVARIKSQVTFDGNAEGIAINESEGVYLFAKDADGLIESNVSLELRVTTAKGAATVDQRVSVQFIEDKNKRAR